MSNVGENITINGYIISFIIVMTAIIPIIPLKY